jgi:hypothetical protein
MGRNHIIKRVPSTEKKLFRVGPQVVENIFLSEEGVRLLGFTPFPSQESP